MTTTDDPRWQDLTDARVVADALIDLYERRGNGPYEDAVSQTDHARQIGAHAMVAGADACTIAGAFLHDLGHLCPPNRSSRHTGGSIDRAHEAVGAQFAGYWFGEDVVAPIRLHVAAKRYLCAVEPDYLSKLSPASMRRLVVQGGPMGDSEARSFEREPHADAAIRLRRWDEQSNEPNAPAPTLSAYHSVLVEALGQTVTRPERVT